ncbi:MAG: heavy metal-associated domain-containing protein [Saprospiraceae bacterium]
MRVFIFLLFAFLFGNCNIAFSQQTTKSTEQTSEKKVVLAVTGMTCQKGCADGIDKRLKNTKGIVRSKTLLSTGESKITFNPSQISVDEIIAVIKDQGYKAEVKDK